MPFETKQIAQPSDGVESSFFKCKLKYFVSVLDCLARIHNMMHIHDISAMV
jgi:hypothetical protein